MSFDDAETLISSAVDWYLGRGTGDRPMKAVIELNIDSPARVDVSVLVTNLSSLPTPVVGDEVEING